MSKEKKVKITLTKSEQKWIEQFRKVVDKAPETLSLFANASRLQIWKHKDFLSINVADGFKIVCDGGDCYGDDYFVNDPEIEYL